VQVFLQGKLLGTGSFLEDSSDNSAAFAGKCLYLSLISEALPRALLARLGLAPELLGTSGGGQFLIVITSESEAAAHQYLVDATRRLGAFTGGRLRLAWAATENLGAWSDVRRRLDEAMARWRGVAAYDAEGQFEPFNMAADGRDDYFERLFRGLPDSAAVGWDPEAEGMLAPAGTGQFFATHFAQADDRPNAATLEDLAMRAAGRKTWGVLCGDIDLFGARLRKTQTIEEYIQGAVYFKQFFAGEVQLLCTQSGFWRKLTVLFTGGDDFSVVGSWDALLPFAREIQRLFHHSAEQYLKELPGPEGKTISMALAIAPEVSSPLSAVYREACRQLEIAKSARRDAIAVFGRTLDWRELNEASEIRDILRRLVGEFGCPAQLIGEIGSFYRETDRVLPAKAGKSRAERPARIWRFHHRLSRALEGPARDREFQKTRAALLSEFTAKNQPQVKLKPAGRVALEWARLSEETEKQ
jgi:CRISPR-associated protein Csm1